MSASVLGGAARRAIGRGLAIFETMVDSAIPELHDSMATQVMLAEAHYHEAVRRMTGASNLGLVRVNPGRISRGAQYNAKRLRRYVDDAERLMRGSVDPRALRKGAEAARVSIASLALALEQGGLRILPPPPDPQDALRFADAVYAVGPARRDLSGPSVRCDLA